MTYTICFDFPEAPGEPVFAWQVPGEPFGFTQYLNSAAEFDSIEVAERVLASSYGSESCKWATVVEVAK